MSSTAQLWSPAVALQGSFRNPVVGCSPLLMRHGGARRACARPGSVDVVFERDINPPHIVRDALR